MEDDELFESSLETDAPVLEIPDVGSEVSQVGGGEGKARTAAVAAIKLPPINEEPDRMGDEYLKHCEKCRQALCLQRPRRHGQSESTHVLSASLSDPHVESYGTKFKFFLVVVYKAGPGAKNLLFVR
eukprot:3265843-Lingulodinium_polyedra.AAC.1